MSLGILDPQKVAILQRAPEQRSERDVVTLFESTKDVKFFTSIPASVHFRLCKSMSLQVVQPKKLVFRQGDVGDAFFILLSGSVHVFIETPAHLEVKQLDYDSLVSVATLSAGAAFGEMALIADKPRNATIRAHNRCRLLRVDKEDYDQVMKRYQEQLLKDTCQFMAQTEFFKAWSQHELSDISCFFRPKEFKAGEILPRGYVYLVKSGHVAVLSRRPLVRDTDHESKMCTYEPRDDEEKKPKGTESKRSRKMIYRVASAWQVEHVSRGGMIGLALSAYDPRRHEGPYRVAWEDTSDNLLHTAKSLQERKTPVLATPSRVISRRYARRKTMHRKLVTQVEEQIDLGTQIADGNEEKAKLYVPKDSVLELLHEDGRVPLINVSSRPVYQKYAPYLNPAFAAPSSLVAITDVSCLYISVSDFVQYVVHFRDEQVAAASTELINQLVRRRRGAMNLPGLRSSAEICAMVAHYENLESPSYLLNDPHWHVLSTLRGCLRNQDSLWSSLTLQGKIAFMQFMQLEVVGKHCVLSLQGSPVDYVYVLLSGSASVFARTWVSHRDGEKFSLLRVMSAGHYVGELELLCGMPACVSVVCNSVCEWALFPRAEFLKMLSGSGTWYPPSFGCFSLLRYLEVFRDCQLSRVIQLTLAADLIKVSSGHLFFRQGHMPAGVYIILSGRVQFVRELEVPDSPMSKIRPLEIMTLSSGEYFGEESLFPSMVFPEDTYTARALSRCQVMFISAARMLRLCQFSVIQSFRALFLKRLQFRRARSVSLMRPIRESCGEGVRWKQPPGFTRFYKRYFQRFCVQWEKAMESAISTFHHRQNPSFNVDLSINNFATENKNDDSVESSQKAAERAQSALKDVRRQTQFYIDSIVNSGKGSGSSATKPPSAQKGDAHRRHFSSAESHVNAPDEDNDASSFNFLSTARLDPSHIPTLADLPQKPGYSLMSAWSCGMFCSQAGETEVSSDTSEHGSSNKSSDVEVVIGGGLSGHWSRAEQVLVRPARPEDEYLSRRERTTNQNMRCILARRESKVSCASLHASAQFAHLRMADLAGTLKQFWSDWTAHWRSHEFSYLPGFVQALLGLDTPSFMADEEGKEASSANGSEDGGGTSINLQRYVSCAPTDGALIAMLWDASKSKWGRGSTKHITNHMRNGKSIFALGASGTRFVAADFIPRQSVWRARGSMQWRCYYGAEWPRVYERLCKRHALAVGRQLGWSKTVSLQSVRNRDSVASHRWLFAIDSIRSLLFDRRYVESVKKFVLHDFSRCVLADVLRTEEMGSDASSLNLISRAKKVRALSQLDLNSRDYVLQEDVERYFVRFGGGIVEVMENFAWRKAEHSFVFRDDQVPARIQWQFKPTPEPQGMSWVRGLREAMFALLGSTSRPPVISDIQEHPLLFDKEFASDDNGGKEKLLDSVQNSATEGKAGGLGSASAAFRLAAVTGSLVRQAHNDDLLKNDQQLRLAGAPASESDDDDHVGGVRLKTNRKYGAAGQGSLVGDFVGDAGIVEPDGIASRINSERSETSTASGLRSVTPHSRALTPSVSRVGRSLADDSEQKSVSDDDQTEGAPDEVATPIDENEAFNPVVPLLRSMRPPLVAATVQSKQVRKMLDQYAVDEVGRSMVYHRALREGTALSHGFSRITMGAKHVNVHLPSRSRKYVPDLGRVINLENFVRDSSGLDPIREITRVYETFKRIQSGKPAEPTPHPSPDSETKSLSDKTEMPKSWVATHGFNYFSLQDTRELDELCLKIDGAGGVRSFLSDLGVKQMFYKGKETRMDGKVKVTVVESATQLANQSPDAGCGDVQDVGPPISSASYRSLRPSKTAAADKSFTPLHLMQHFPRQIFLMVWSSWATREALQDHVPTQSLSIRQQRVRAGGHVARNRRQLEAEYVSESRGMCDVDGNLFPRQPLHHELQWRGTTDDSEEQLPAFMRQSLSQIRPSEKALMFDQTASFGVPEAAPGTSQIHYGGRNQHVKPSPSLSPGSSTRVRNQVSGPLSGGTGGWSRQSPHRGTQRTSDSTAPGRRSHMGLEPGKPLRRMPSLLPKFPQSEEMVHRAMDALAGFTAQQVVSTDGVQVQKSPASGLMEITPSLRSPAKLASLPEMNRPSHLATFSKPYADALVAAERNPGHAGPPIDHGVSLEETSSVVDEGNDAMGVAVTLPETAEDLMLYGAHAMPRGDSVDVMRRSGKDSHGPESITKALSTVTMQSRDDDAEEPVAEEKPEQAPSTRWNEVASHSHHRWMRHHRSSRARQQVIEDLGSKAAAKFWGSAGDVNLSDRNLLRIRLDRMLASTDQTDRALANLLVAVTDLSPMEGLHAQFHGHSPPPPGKKELKSSVKSSDPSKGDDDDEKSGEAKEPKRDKEDTTGGSKIRMTVETVQEGGKRVTVPLQKKAKTTESTSDPPYPKLWPVPLFRVRPEVSLAHVVGLDCRLASYKILKVILISVGVHLLGCEVIDPLLWRQTPSITVERNEHGLEVDMVVCYQTATGYQMPPLGDIARVIHSAQLRYRKMQEMFRRFCLGDFNELLKPNSPLSPERPPSVQSDSSSIAQVASHTLLEFGFSEHRVRVIPVSESFLLSLYNVGNLNSLFMFLGVTRQIQNLVVRVRTGTDVLSMISKQKILEQEEELDDYARVPETRKAAESLCVVCVTVPEHLRSRRRASSRAHSTSATPGMSCAWCGADLVAWRREGNELGRGKALVPGGPTSLHRPVQTRNPRFAVVGDSKRPTSHDHHPDKKEAGGGLLSYEGFLSRLITNTRLSKDRVAARVMARADDSVKAPAGESGAMRRKTGPDRPAFRIMKWQMPSSEMILEIANSEGKRVAVDIFSQQSDNDNTQV